MWCRPYTARDTKFAHNIFDTVTSHLGIRWNKKIAKLDHVVLPESENMWNWYLRDGMSQWGLIFYRYNNTYIIKTEEKILINVLIFLSYLKLV